MAIYITVCVWGSRIKKDRNRWVLMMILAAAFLSEIGMFLYEGLWYGEERGLKVN
jgi:hypothetical protein